MKLGRLLLLIFLVSPTGCSFFGYAAHNLFSAPYEAIQECSFRHRVQALARKTWENIACTDGHTYSTPYARGFEDGFVDYVDANGTGEPPAMPPAWLRRGLTRSESGPSDITDWYAGFRHGARVARESGLRERTVMPIGLPARQPTDPIPAQVIVPTTPPPKEMPPALTKTARPKDSGPAPLPIPVLEVSNQRVGDALPLPADSPKIAAPPPPLLPVTPVTKQEPAGAPIGMVEIIESGPATEQPPPPVVPLVPPPAVPTIPTPAKDRDPAPVPPPGPTAAEHRVEAALPTPPDVTKAPIGRPQTMLFPLKERESAPAPMPGLKASEQRVDAMHLTPPSAPKAASQTMPFPVTREPARTPVTATEASFQRVDAMNPPTPTPPNPQK